MYPLEPALLHVLLRDVLDALKFIHLSLKCVHRDVRKPNVLQKDLDGNFFLIDFGLLAKIEEDGVGPMFGDVEKCPPLRNFLRYRIQILLRCVHVVDVITGFKRRKFL